MSISSDQLPWLHHILQETDLLSFKSKIIDELQITQLQHFNYVKVDDLVRLGISRPAARRLLDAFKRYKQEFKKNAKSSAGLIDKILKKERSQSVDVSDVTAALAASSGERRKSSLTPISNLLNASDAVQFTCLIQESELVLGKKLGVGSFGIVYRAEWTPLAKQRGKTLVAVKQLKNDILRAPNAFKDFLREVSAMHSLSHPNLISLYGVVLSFPQMIVSELAPYGSLQERLRAINVSCPTSTDNDSQPPLLLDRLCEFAVQIATGMAYLESRRSLHRDLATRNILLTKPNEVKICDFGLVCALPTEEDYYTMKEKKKMPFAWCAPESLRSRKFSHATDCWMFGVTLWEMFSYGADPWMGLNGQEILDRISPPRNERLTRPAYCPRTVYKLMLTCWSDDPTKRPSFHKLLELFKEIKPFDVRAISNFSEEGHLDVKKGDRIIIIDGRSENYWWTGQNRRTLSVGSFPRGCVTTMRALTGQDISMPLRNSFIHTGHADNTGSGKSWGNPKAIDEVYLRNPMQPPDILEVTSKYSDRLTSESPSPPLIDLSTNSSSTNSMSVPPRKYPQSAPAPTLPIASADADWSDGSSTFYDGISETSASSSSPSEVQLRHHRPVLPPPLPLSSPKHQQYHHPSTITTASVDSIALPPKYSNWSEQMCDEIRHIATNDEVYKEILPWQKVKDPFDVNNVHWETSTHAYWPHQDSTRSSEFLDPAVVSHLDSLSAVDQSRRAPLARPESGFMIPKSQSEIAQESDSPPPLPVRLRRPLATSPTTHTESNLRIYPVKVDGKQMSHTHYWLIPPPTSKQSPLPSNNNNNNLHSPLSSLTSPTLADSLMTNSCMAARVTEPHPMPDMRRYSGVYHNVAQASSKTPTPSSGPVPNATNSAPETQANPVFANLQDTLKHLMNLVNGASEKDARSALNHCKGHIPSAIAHLQVEQLHRLGLTHVSRDVCRKYLEKYNWDMEQAAAALVDRYCDSSGSRV